MKKYTIRRIDPTDKKATLQLHLLHNVCFANTAPKIKKHEIKGGWCAPVPPWPGPTAPTY